MTDFCPQAVIFDMDGLLVDSEPVWAIAEDAMMAARGKQSDPEIQQDADRAADARFSGRDVPRLSA